MRDLALSVLQRFGFHMSLLLVGVAIVVGGLKFYEHATYIPTQARVVGTSTKCEMSLRIGTRSTNETMIECADVAAFRARNSDDSWQVRQVVFVDLAYAIESGRTVKTTARLGKLELSSATVGETIALLRSPSNPTNVTGPIGLIYLMSLGIALVVGIGMFAVSHWAKQQRLTQYVGTPVPVVLPGAVPSEVPTIAPSNVRSTPSFVASGAGFGKRASTVDYVRRG